MNAHRSNPSFRSSSRTSLALMACVIVAAILMPARFAMAQERARDFIEPRISKTQFQQFCQQVGLESDQRQIANIAFSDYETSLNDLATRLDTEARTAGQQRVDESLSGKMRVEAEELKHLRAGVLRVYLQAGPEVDAALDALIGGVEVLLTDDQTLKFETARRWLDREIILHPRASGANYQEYAGDGVDVLALVDEARAAGGELAGLSADALNAILNTYEDQLDVVLVETSSANRQGAILRKIAGIEQDADALKHEETAAVERWQRLYQLNQQTVAQIAATAQLAISPTAAAAFNRRFDRESFTWLYPRKKPDREIEWIRQQSDLPLDVMAKAEATYAEYIVKRDNLSRAAIDMMLKARTDFQSYLYAMMDNASIDPRIKDSLWSDLMKNTGEQSHLEATVTSQLEALLDDASRKLLRDFMRRADRPMGRPGGGGPGGGGGGRNG